MFYPKNQSHHTTVKGWSLDRKIIGLDFYSFGLHVWVVTVLLIIALNAVCVGGVVNI